MNNNEQRQQADDPSGPGWRDVEPDEILQTGDIFWCVDHWEATQNVGTTSSLYGNGYRRRIEPQQSSDIDPETMEDLRRRLADAEALVAEAWQSGAQVNAKLRQLREQVQTLTRDLQTERDNSMIALRSQHRLGQEALAEALQTWLRPVLELVAEHPEEASPLAVAVLGYLPGIASRLIEE